jgi:hypothetical protein
MKRYSSPCVQSKGGKKMNGMLIPAVMLVIVIGGAIYMAKTGRNVNS